MANDFVGQASGSEAAVPSALRLSRGVDDSHGRRHPRQLPLHRRHLQEHFQVSSQQAVPRRQCRGGSALCVFGVYVCVWFMCVGVFVGGVRARCVLEGMVM